MANTTVFLSGGETLYVELPGHPKKSIGGAVTKTVQLDDIVSLSAGPRVSLDLDSQGKLIGIEILVSVND